MGILSDAAFGRLFELFTQRGWRNTNSGRLDRLGPLRPPVESGLASDEAAVSFEDDTPFGEDSVKLGQGVEVVAGDGLRDPTCAEEAGDGIFVPSLIALLRRACRIGRLRDRLTDVQLANRRQLVKALSLLLEAKPEHPEGAKLHAAIGKIRRNLFVFVTWRALEPTNNASERALRPCATWRKVTGGCAPPGAPPSTLTSAL